MLFRHFFAFPPASDMSSETAPRLFTAAPSLPAASGLGRLTAGARRHGSSSKKGKSTDKAIRKIIRRHLNNRSAVTGGKVGVHSTKGAGAMELHLRGHDSTSGAEPSSLSGLLPSSPVNSRFGQLPVFHIGPVQCCLWPPSVWFGIQTSPSESLA